MDLQPPFTLPTPTDTPYRTPSSSLSRRSREYEDMSPSSTPPPLPSDMRVAKKRSNESQRALDDHISPLDPRRFTPNLHASLVSEILSLRRELENKTKSIDQLEQSLDAAQSQNETLNKSMLTSNKEVRSVKRQMQLLEGGTLSALNDLSKERDEAVQESADLRNRLEQSQKRAKTHEENAGRTQTLLTRERDSWATERRALETKVHVAEGRLKTVLGEVAHAQAHAHAHAQEKTTFVPADERNQTSQNPTSLPGSPTHFNAFGVRDRPQSAASSVYSDTPGGRTSVMSMANGLSATLADELALEEIGEDDGDNEGIHGRVSPDALPEERERPASSLSIKARRVLGLPFDIEEMENSERPYPVNEQGSVEQTTSPTPRTRSYVDAGVQHSRPDSTAQNADSSTENSHEKLQDMVVTASSESPASPIMVSTSCQTIEYLPSPPLTPKQDDNGLATIHESAYEKVETKEMSTQTEPKPRPGGSYGYVHSRTSTHDLGVPMISIVPPTSRPATPQNTIVLPPQTRNASCQAEIKVQFNYTTSSMQTEEIRVDRRNIPLDSSISGTSVSASSHTQTTVPKSKTNAAIRRGSAATVQPVSNSSLKRIAAPASSVPPSNDSGALAEDAAASKSRPIRSSSLFAGFDDLADENQDEIDDDIFFDDDFASRPVARFTLRSGKLVSQESTLEDIGELSAASAGEALALDNLRRSENALPPELRQVDSLDHSKSLKRQNIMRRAPSASKQADVRRTAMISSGVAAHQSKHSQSTIESGSIDGTVPPPIPIPLRYSSARIVKSTSEGGRNSRGSSNVSPTRQHRTKYKPTLRKARSGPALSPAAQERRQRSKSPPLDSRVSIVPEMPLFQMPDQSSSSTPFPLTNDWHTPYEASAPRPAIPTGPGRGHKHVKQTSDAGLLQQTSVVDAIAQTMVGEWMFKYVRRRKSFGKPEKDWDPNKSVEELTSNPAGAGVRHKRWVWLAPYERAIMWSSKQPMNGNALLGKSGRKSIVKSVLDVKDDNPMPKNSLTGPAFNRSILILTPQRALKFTATNQERHFVWLTALSFLSHSPLSIGDLAALPPAPDDIRSPSPPPQPLGGSFRRRTIRDSIRIAKGPGRPEGGQRSITTDGSMPPSEYQSTRPPTRDVFDEDDAALPPTIRRFHTRNRSNTAPRAPASSFFSFSHKDHTPAMPQTRPFAHQGGFTNDVGPSDRSQFLHSRGNPSVQGSRRGSEASAFGRPNFANSYNNHAQPPALTFSDSSHNASMTMRMDAFIDNKQAGRGGFRNLRLGHGPRATNKDPSFWGLEETPSTISPIESMTPTQTNMRFSDSAGGANTDRDIFRGF